MNWYFIILCLLYSFSLGIVMSKHGCSKEGKYNFFSSLIGLAIQLFLIVNAIRIGF